MPIKPSTSFYIGAFVILVIIILALLVLSPTQNSFFDLKATYPILYYNLHDNQYLYDNMIKEIVLATNIIRVDTPPDTAPTESSHDTSATNLEWISYAADKFPYVRGKVEILPLIYNNKQYDNTIHFPLLMQFIKIQPNILNIYFWKFGAESALLQHYPTNEKGASNIHEENILDKKVLRYTLAINVLSCAEEDCSIWVNGHLKKLVYDKYVLWDPSKEFSLHNDSATDGDVLFLNIDLLRL